MRNHARRVGCRPAVVGAALVVAAGLIAGGCSSSSSSRSSRALRCPSKRGAAVTGTSPAATGRAAAGWTQPNADLASTRYVASAITSANVSKLGVAWAVPLTIPTTHTDGAYAATPVIVNGVVYVQDLDSDVFAIGLATGKVLWRHDYDSPNGGPDGVNVVGGVVYAATAKAAVALNAATGAQLWSRTLIGNDHEGIAMAPGYNRGTVYVSTVPANVTGQYLPGGEGILWALNAGDRRAGVVLEPGAELVGQSGRQLRRRAVVHAVVRRPGQHLPGYRQPGPDLRHQELAAGEQPARPGPVYRLGGQAEPGREAAVVLPAHPARPVGLGPAGPAGAVHRGRAAGGDRRRQGRNHDRAGRADRQAAVAAPGGRARRHQNDGLLTEHATLASRGLLPAKFCLEPSTYGGILTQLASNGSTTFAAVNDLALPASPAGFTGSLASHIKAVENAVGEMVAVNQDTGAVIWDTPLPSSPYGAATVTNDVVFTTTFKGELYALDAATGAILFKSPMSAGRNAPVAVDGDYVMASAGVRLSTTQRNMIIAYKLGATGKLPNTVGP